MLTPKFVGMTEVYSSFSTAYENLTKLWGYSVIALEGVHFQLSNLVPFVVKNPDAVTFANEQSAFGNRIKICCSADFKSLIFW